MDCTVSSTFASKLIDAFKGWSVCTKLDSLNYFAKLLSA